MKPANASQMRDHIKGFIGKLERYLNKDPMDSAWKKGGKYYFDMDYAIEKKDDRHIELRTDSTLYEIIYDSSSGDWGSIASKWGSAFRDVVQRYGWIAENRGGGIIDIVKER